MRIPSRRRLVLSYALARRVVSAVTAIECRPYSMLSTRGFPGCGDDVFAYTNGVPGSRTVAGFDVDAGLRSRCVFAVEDADFEMDQMKGFAVPDSVRTQRLPKCKVERAFAGPTPPLAVCCSSSPIFKRTTASGSPTELIHTW